MLAAGQPLTRSRSNPNSLRDRQSNALRQMLHFGEAINKKETIFEPEWKVLIYDETGKNIISPLLSVKQLHEAGVTLYMSLHADRDEIADTPAIYLCEPTTSNISRISADLKASMYQEYYFNFTSPIMRPELEALAQAAVAAGAASNIKKIFDQHMNFISLEPDLFVLKHLKLAKKPNLEVPESDSSFYKFNTNKMENPQPYINAVSAGLYAIFATLGAMPIIRANKGNMADEIAKILDKKLRDSLRDSRATMFMDNGLGFQRPLLIMLDRNVDYSAPLMHSMALQSICHDVLDLNLNYITVKQEVEAPAGNPDAPKSFRTKQIDCSKDKTWQENKLKKFMEVAHVIQTKTNEWQSDMTRLTQMKSDMGLENVAPDGAVDVEASNKLLGNAVKNMPEKMQEKAELDDNMAIALEISKRYQEQDYDKYQQMESALNIKDIAPSEMMAEHGQEEDKVRYLLYMLMRDVIKLGEIDKFKEELSRQGKEKYFKAIDYIRRMKQISAGSASFNEQQSDSSKASQMFSNPANVFKFGSAAKQLLTSGIENLTLGKKLLPVTRLVDQIIDQKDTGSINVGYWDPKLPVSSSTMARSKSPVTDVIVFIVGGGSYTEYIDIIQNKANLENGRRLIYGSTDLINPMNFLCDLQRLGTEE